MMKVLSRLFVLLLCLLGSSGLAWAQFSGSLQGTVQDATGAAVPAATVTLTNTETNVSQKTTADSSGVYRFPSLAPGSYKVSASQEGFSPAAVTLTLSTNENRNVPLSLAIGQVSAQVQVTERAPLLDTSDTRNQLTIDRVALAQLPLAARNPLELVTLAPGVTGIGSGTATTFNPENSVDASANGRGANANLYVVDGLDVTSSIRPGVVNLTPNADSVQEASVQTNTY
ncbi:MAG: carboxypeptidase regulatory-like domain-containing protein, partial [Terriglobus roseus]|nr:carboxypeptidase regulatory-like domain-containing protein [Terriglobus roseus]